MEPKLYLERAENELELARIVFKISNDETVQKDIFAQEFKRTFYSNVISLCYYSIFYSAKSYLLQNGIKTFPPEEHKKTYDEFNRLVQSGKIDVELFKIYENAIIQADLLLGIFKIEKDKRGKFTYQRIPQANFEPAKDSIENAKKFYSNINLILNN